MKLLLNPWVLLGLVVWSLFLIGASYHKGYDAAANECEAQKAEAMRDAIARANKTAAKDSATLSAHEQDRERIRTVFKPIREEVIRYVETHAADTGECLDPDGLRLWRAANAGDRPTPAAPQPDYTLPRPAPAALGARGGPAGQPHPDGGAVPRMQGQAQSAGRLGGQR